MAKLPEKALLIFNPSSGAPGFIVENVYCLPGVPSILNSMLGGLNNRIKGGKKILSKTLSLMTVESEIATSLEEAQNKTGINDAVIALSGKLNDNNIVLVALDFSFIGGSMGSVVGEVISKSIDYANDNAYPLLIISSSGGARMQEGAISLMQLAKTSSKMSRFSKNGGLFISLLTNPTMGGASASFSMQGDIIIAEPNALIGFAGQRVIKQTIGEDLPKGFQRSEFLLKKGFIDHIVPRNQLKEKISSLIKFFYE